MDDVTIRLEIPASYAELSVLSCCIGELLGRVGGLANARRVTYAAQLAAHEACANIIDHAYGGAAGRSIVARLMLEAAARRLVVELEDRGRPFDPSAVAAPDLSVPHEGGYGVFLIRSLVDEVCYSRRGGCNRLRLVKCL